MSEITDHKITSLVSDEVTQDIKSEVLKIWNALKNPHNITSNQVWPFRNIINHA